MQTFTYSYQVKSISNPHNGVAIIAIVCYNYLCKTTPAQDKRSSAMFKKIFKKIQENQQRRADYWILMNMSDKELHDMGISRGEVRQKVYG